MPEKPQPPANPEAAATTIAAASEYAAAAALSNFAPGPPSQATAKMTRDQFLDAQYKVSFTAGMNQRYHQRRASHWTWWDRAVRIAVGACALVSLVQALAPPSAAWSIAVAALGAASALVLNIIPIAGSDTVCAIT